MTTHGLEHTREYRLWIDMRRRCHDSRRPDYHRYGARGIVVCEEWRESFEAFYRDMGPRPGPGFSLERIDNDGPYSSSNCVWATKKQQDRNRRNSRSVTIQGETMNLADAAERFGVHYPTVLSRLRMGWSEERALLESIHARAKPDIS